MLQEGGQPLDPDVAAAVAQEELGESSDRERHRAHRLPIRAWDGTTKEANEIFGFCEAVQGVGCPAYTHMRLRVSNADADAI